MARIEAGSEEQKGSGITGEERALLQLLRRAGYGASTGEDNGRLAGREMVKNYLDMAKGLSNMDEKQLKEIHRAYAAMQDPRFKKFLSLVKPMLGMNKQQLEAMQRAAGQKLAGEELDDMALDKGFGSKHTGHKHNAGVTLDKDAMRDSQDDKSWGYRDESGSNDQDISDREKSSSKSYAEDEAYNYPLAEGNSGAMPDSNLPRRRSARSESARSESARSWNRKLSALEDF